MESESYEAHWRAAENDAVPYPKDFPEWITMLIELLNGGKNPSEISLRLILNKDGTVNFRYRDNGFGCSFKEAFERLFRWASESSVDGKSIYGHGTKKFLAKSGGYKTLSFVIRSRTLNDISVNEWRGPYKGIKTEHDFVTIEDFPKHGFEIELTMDIKKLGEMNTAEKAFHSIKELICSRKSQSVLNSIKIHLHVRSIEKNIILKENSIDNNWKDLRTTLFDMSTDENDTNGVRLLYSEDIDFIPGKVKLIYESFTTGLLENIPGFNVYGKMGGGVGTRIHTSNEDTMIEAYSWHDATDIKVHPSNWHRIDFARLLPITPSNISDLPQPATLKVQYRYESDEWKHFIETIRNIYENNKDKLKLPDKKDIVARKNSSYRSASAPVVTAPVAPVVTAPVATVAAPVAPVVTAPVVKAPVATVATVAAEPVVAGPVVAGPVVATVTKAVVKPIVSKPKEQTNTVIVTEKKVMFDKTILNDEFNRLEKEKKNPTKVETPKWLTCEDMIGYTEDSKHYLHFYRQRQKGSITDDIHKAYICLIGYANENKVSKENISMKFILNLKDNSSNKRRIIEFELEKKKLLNTYGFEYISCLKFHLITSS